MHGEKNQLTMCPKIYLEKSRNFEARDPPAGEVTYNTVLTARDFLYLKLFQGEMNLY